MSFMNYMPFAATETDSSELATQVRFLTMGAMIGCIASAFASLFSGGFSIENLLNWVLFSIVITCCINNATRLLPILVPTETTTWWKRALFFYLLLLVATAAGVVISYGLLSFVYGSKVFSWQYIRSGFLISITVSLFVGTIVFVNRIRTAATRLKLQTQDLALARLEQLKTAAELASLQSRINPHFLYNALNAIAALIHDDPDAAEEMTINLATLFRYSINTQNENYATIRSEVEILNAYLAIEKRRFGDRIDFAIRIDPHLLAQQIPRFLLQPLVENSIKHALAPLTTNGFISVSIIKENETLRLTVQDNGLPFELPIKNGFGLTSTVDKLRLLYGEGQFTLQAQNEPQKQISIVLPTR